LPAPAAAANRNGLTGNVRRLEAGE
jgi:hypothetical protein